MNKLKGVSLFANVGIAETYLKEVGINIVVANEIDEKRAKFYQYLYPDAEMIVGDITDSNIFNKVYEMSKEKKVDFLIKIFWIFVIGSVFGFIIEILYILVYTRTIEIRQGLIYGPFIQVYGIGAVLYYLFFNSIGSILSSNLKLKSVTKQSFILFISRFISVHIITPFHEPPLFLQT